MQSATFTKWYKIIRRGKSLPVIHIEQDRLEMIMQDPQQLVRFIDNDTGEWRVFNKADLVDAHYDEDFTREKNKPAISVFLNKDTNAIVELPENALLPSGNYEKLR